MFEFLQDKDVLNIYPYGSTVYGTESEDSDLDFIVVINDNNDSIEQISTSECDVTLYNLQSFKKAIEEHEISVLECLSIPSTKLKKKSMDFDFELDLGKLRHSISSKSSNSWVKAKKKMTVEKDLDIYTGKKSLFHSFRIILFGIQLAKYGEIIDYTEANEYWFEIKDDTSEDWEHYKNKYQGTFNKLKSEFKLIAPKGK